MYTNTFMLAAISKGKNAVILLKHRTNAMYVTKHLLSPEISMNTNALILPATINLMCVMSVAKHLDLFLI